MHNWPVSVVANPINTDHWKPFDQGIAREMLGLPTEVPLLLFGAMAGGQDPHKGFDLLLRTLEYLRDDSGAQGLELVVFGQNEPQPKPALGFPIHYIGHQQDDLSLRAVYSAASVLAIPSRLDNLPNVGVEALACGIPVVAFNTGGLPDIVTHKQSGYLAQPFDTEDFAEGIIWSLAHMENGNLQKNARLSAIEKFSFPVVAEQYLKIYQQVYVD